MDLPRRSHADLRLLVETGFKCDFPENLRLTQGDDCKQKKTDRFGESH